MSDVMLYSEVQARGRETDERYGLHVASYKLQVAGFERDSRNKLVTF